MAQIFSSSFITSSIPGAYNQVSVQSTPVGVGASGAVVIMGEADGGDSYLNVSLKDNAFTPDQLDKVMQKYISGPIVDAFRAFSAPSNDADINGSANLIYIVKTNSSTKASALVDTNYGTLSNLNWGKPGNQYKFQITSIAAESAPTVSGNTIPTFGAALNGQTFDIRLNGSAKTTITLSGTAGDHATISALIIELNAQLPAGIVASLGAASNSLKLTVAADNAAYRKGWGKSFELVETVSGDLAALGLIAGLNSSAQEPGVELVISNASTGLSETKDVQGAVALQIGYQGTTGTVSIDQTAKTLTTTVSGGSGTSLTIDMAQYRTIADMATYIASQPGYFASASAAVQQLPTSVLDEVSNVGIGSSSSSKPGRIKNAASAFSKIANTSNGLSFAPTAKFGLPAPGAQPVYLTGGTKGGTLAADIIAAVTQLAGINVNIVVPLFSQDSSADIALSLTDSASTYTIDAIHAAVKSHCVQYSTPKLKKNRLCILSYWGTYAAAKAKAQGLASYRAVFAFQQATQVNNAGVITSFMPWYTACVAAGMQTGGFYKAIVNKFANVISFTDPVGYDSGSPGSVEDALSAGMLMLAKEIAGNRWVSDQTTYGFDSNFVYNSLQAVYTSDILALDLTASFQSAFVGKSLADVTAASALSFLTQKMAGYRNLKLIAGSSDAVLGFKNPKITINAPTLEVAVEIKLATAVYFIPISISVSAIQQSA